MLRLIVAHCRFHFAGLSFPRTDDAESGGRNSHSRSAKKPAAILIYFFRHFISLQGHAKQSRHNVVQENSRDGFGTKYGQRRLIRLSVGLVRQRGNGHLLAPIKTGDCGIYLFVHV